MIKLKGIKRSKWEYVYVVFCDSDVLWWQIFLKKGYRHCFLILADKANNYLFIDTTDNRIIFNLLESDKNDNIAELCASLNATLLKIPMVKIMDNIKKRKAPMSVLNCVQLIKRILGIHKRNILTPWNLFMYLQKHYCN
jgi:hypothetical protein